ncbi:MAG: hypothetical protein ACREOZ_05190, partial [Gloeomargaritales cyanobacterium]
AAGKHCVCPQLALPIATEGTDRHACPDCKKPLHGICGVYSGDDSAVTYRNRCQTCASKRRPDACAAAETVSTFAVEIPYAPSASYARRTTVPSHKCNFRSCKNNNKREILYDCCNEKCGKKVHRKCYILIAAKEKLPTLSGENEESNSDGMAYVCTKTCHQRMSRMLNIETGNQRKTRWDTDQTGLGNR